MATTLVFGLGTFLFVGVMASWGALEVIDYIYTEVGATNNSLWVTFLFLVNTVLVVGLRGILLDRLMNVAYKGHKRIQRMFKRN